MSRGTRRNNNAVEEVEEEDFRASGDSRSPSVGEPETDMMAMLRVLMEEQRKADRAREDARRQEEFRKDEARLQEEQRKEEIRVQREAEIAKRQLEQQSSTI